MLENPCQNRASWCDRSRWGGPILLGLSLLLFVYRFLNFDLCVFINDEPVLLAESRNALQAGRFLTHSPLIGTQSIQYGPTTLWLFSLIHYCFGPDVQYFTLAIALLGTLSNAALAVSVGRFFGDRYLTPATLVAFVASSPYLFFWSRIPWDPLVNICAGFAVSLLCTKRPLGALRVVALGSLLGFGVSTHPAMTPLAGVILLLVVLRSASGQRLRNLALSLVITLAINGPFLYYLANQQGAAGARKHQAAQVLFSRVFSRFLTEPLRVLSTARIDYFFDTAWQSFADQHPVAARLSEISSEALATLTWCIPLGLVVAFFAQRRFAHRSLVVSGVLVWVGYAAFYTWLKLDPHPHYQFSVWWVALVALAGLLSAARQLPKVYGKALIACWLLSLAQFGFLVSWMHYIRTHEGTRGIYYGVPQGYQKAAIRSLCQHGGPRIYVSNRTQIFNHALDYLVSTEPSCSNRQVQIGGAGFATERGAWTLSYAAGDTAKLTLTQNR